MTKQYEQAIAELKKRLNLSLIVYLLSLSGSCLWFSDREEQVLLAGKEVFRIATKFSVEQWIKKLPYKNEAGSERLKKGLHKAGLSD